METLHRVLGYADNPLISSLLQQNVLRVEDGFRAIVATGDPGGVLSKILSAKNSAEFFQLPDVSAIVAKHWISGIGKAEWKFLCQAALAFLEGRRIEETDRIVTVPGGVTVSPIDGNPFNAYDAHPDNRKDGVGVGWGSVGKDEWETAYSEAFRILQTADLGFFEEIRRFLLKIVPLWTDANAHRSASYAEAFGCAYLGLTPGEKYPEHSVLEGLIHEWSHNKANLITAIHGPLLTNDRREAYYSAYRPDPRPIVGILLGVHAFVATVRVFLNAFEHVAISPQSRIEKVFSLHLKNRSALSVLSKYLSPTQEGLVFFQEIEMAHAGNETRISPYRSNFPLEYASAEKAFDRHFSKAVSDASTILS